MSLEQNLLPPLNRNFPTIQDFFGQSKDFGNQEQIKWLKGIETWLSMLDRSDTTYRCYKKESERFLLWCLYVNKKSFNDLEVEDVKKYSTFITNVESVAPEWCGARIERESKDWKPFVGNLGPVSHDTCLTILQSMFEWLVGDDRIKKNPFKLLINSRLQSKKQIDVANAFSEEEIKFILSFINDYVAETQEQKRVKIRNQWLFGLIVMTGLRCGEVASSTFSSIRKNHGKWYINVVGKGHKERTIPLNDKIISLMKEYRSHFDLNEMPGANERRPLVFSVRGFTKITERAIYYCITDVFRKAGDLTDDEHLKVKLNKASPHWLRGTFATLVNEKTDSNTLQNLMGHSSFNTTLRYINISDKKSVDAINSIDL